VGRKKFFDNWESSVSKRGNKAEKKGGVGGKQNKGSEGFKLQQVLGFVARHQKSLPTRVSVGKGDQATKFELSSSKMTVPVLEE